MKILKFLGKGKVGFADVPRPECDENTVVIKVKASAICGSELHVLKEPPDDAEFFNGGHEVVGTIEEAPPGSPFERGMRVGACVVQGCGKCEWCTQGYETACENKSYYASGAHAEYFRLGALGVRPIPDGVDWPEAVLLTGDGLGVPVRCSRRLGDTRGRKVLVLGLGPIGLSNVLVQAFKGAEVMAADLFEYRVNLAKELGAVRAVSAASEDFEQAVLDWTGGRGADVVILAAGNNKALLSAIDLVKHHGTVFQVAEIYDATFNPSAAFIQKEITMTGSWYYTGADWKEMLAMYEAGLEYAKLVTHTFPFLKAQEAYDLFVSGNSGKVVLTY